MSITSLSMMFDNAKVRHSDHIEYVDFYAVIELCCTRCGVIQRVRMSPSAPAEVRCCEEGEP